MRIFLRDTASMCNRSSTQQKSEKPFRLLISKIDCLFSVISLPRDLQGVNKLRRSDSSKYWHNDGRSFRFRDTFAIPLCVRKNHIRLNHVNPACPLFVSYQW